MWPQGAASLLCAHGHRGSQRWLYAVVWAPGRLVMVVAMVARTEYYNGEEGEAGYPTNAVKKKEEGSQGVKEGRKEWTAAVNRIASHLPITRFLCNGG